MEDLRVWIPARVVRLKIVVFFLLGETWLVWELASESYYPESPKVTTEASKTIGLLYIQIYKYKNTIRGQILMTIFEHQNKNLLKKYPSTMELQCAEITLFARWMAIICHAAKNVKTLLWQNIKHKNLLSISVSRTTSIFPGIHLSLK